MVIIGSENSSNTVALEQVAVAFGCPRVVRINDASELPDDLSGTVGVTAGASAPEALVQAVVERLDPVHGVHRAPVTVEEEYFPPPPELRELLRGLEQALGLVNGAQVRAVGRRRNGVEGAGRRPGDGGFRRARAPGRLRSGAERHLLVREWAMSTSTTHRTSFTRMDVSTRDEWMVIGTETVNNQVRVADRVLGMLESLSDVYDGFGVDQLTHGLQTATRAERAGADDEMVVASLCHDIGKAVCVPNHPRIAAEILRPYVRPEVTAAIAAHQDFQGRHYYHHFGMDPDMQGRVPGRALVRVGRAVRRRVGPEQLRPRLSDRAAVPLRAQGAGHLRQPARLLMSPTQKHRWLTRQDSRGQKRVAALQRFTLDSARQDFEARYPQVRFGPIVGLIAAYHEEKNIGDVLKAMPTMVGDLEVTTLVVVDGGSDNTAGVALDAGVLTCILPVNLGQGAALKLGYELAAAHGARYVVTLDADGQNDPSELPSHGPAAPR